MTQRILLHAGVADSRMYRDQLDALAPARALDLPGFGQTPLDTDSVDFRSFVRDTLPDEAVTLVGTSLGGQISLELALESPGRVAALVLVGPGLDGHEWSDEVKASWQEEEAALERGDLDAAVDANLRLWLAGPRRPLAAVDAGVRELAAQMQRRAFELQEGHDDLRVVELEPPASQRLHEIAVPTLVVTGDEDVADIHEIADRLAAEIPGAERATIPATAHLPSLERPTEFNRIVLAFLGEHGV